MSLNHLIYISFEAFLGSNFVNFQERLTETLDLPERNFFEPIKFWIVVMHTGENLHKCLNVYQKKLIIHLWPVLGYIHYESYRFSVS